MAHTPAPWIWADDRNLYEAAPWQRWQAWAESPDSNLEDMPYKPDAIITTDSGVYGPHGDDAPLIAAAPELLFALYECVDILPDCDNTHVEDVLAIVHAAIAKAEGR